MPEKKVGDGGQGEMQRIYDEAQEKGYFGEAPDPTPNEAYTVRGVIGGAPTPETDEGAKADADKAAAELATKQEGGKA